jgi:hypothetical protein
VDQADAISAFQIHVVYASPADAPDSFSERVAGIVDDLASISQWWRAQDPSRAPRFDLLAASCEPWIERVDVSDVRLPHDGAYYAAPRQTFLRLRQDLERPPLSFESPDKKYVVYYDGPLDSNAVCGVSTQGPARSNGISLVYLESPCGHDLGRAGEAAGTAVHELLHNLGAWPRLHGCAGTRSHACDSTADVLYYASETGAVLARLRLDVNHDDYYGLARGEEGSWDVRDSVFLERFGALPREELRRPVGLVATSSGSRISLSWPGAATGEAGLVYRLYRDRMLLGESRTPGASDRARVGATVAYTLRVAASDGRLSSGDTILFRVGTGIVDESGALVCDTVVPPRVTGLVARRAPGILILRWRPVADAGGLAGYRLFRDGRPVGAPVPGPSVRLSGGDVRGMWTVAAVDRARNTGPPSRGVRVS